jgi:hypothetical protein
MKALLLVQLAVALLMTPDQGNAPSASAPVDLGVVGSQVTSLP